MGPTEQARFGAYIIKQYSYDFTRNLKCQSMEPRIHAIQ